MKDQTCCFTGHRDIPKSEYPKIQKHLESEIINLIQQGVNTFMVGGALGFDVMAAFCMLKLKERFSRIRLVLVLPCGELTEERENDGVAIYRIIIHRADEVICMSDYYYRGCIQKRNRYIVDNSQFCLCYVKETASSAAYTVNYAENEKLQIINIAKG